MAGVASGVTVTLPDGTLAEVASIKSSNGGLSVGYNSTFNPNAGTLVFTSYDHPGSTIGKRGTVGVTGTNISLSFPRGYVTRVDTSASTRGVVMYTTTVRLVTH